VVSPGLRLSVAVIPINVVRVCASRCRTRTVVRSRLRGAAALSLSFLLVAAASVHAQAPQAASPDRRSPLSEVAHNFTSWLNRVTGSSAPHHRATSLLPLPRPRPADHLSPPVASNKELSTLAPAPTAPKNKAPLPVLIND